MRELSLHSDAIRADDLGGMEKGERNVLFQKVARCENMQGASVGYRMLTVMSYKWRARGNVIRLTRNENIRRIRVSAKVISLKEHRRRLTASAKSHKPGGKQMNDEGFSQKS